MVVRIRAFDRALVDRHIHSGEGILGSNPTTPKILSKVFAARWRLLRNAPSKGHRSRYITLFLKGTDSVVSFHELMRVSLAGLKRFLR